jgi:hypothetical protein
MRRSLVVTLALLAIVRATPAVAQTCMGMASYSTGPVQVAGHGSFVDGANQFGATVGYGLARSVFGNVGIATTSWDGADASLNFGGQVGYQMQMSKAQICPVASLSLGNGPDGAGLNRSTRSAMVGLAVGTAFGTSRMQIVPTAGIGVENLHANVEDTGTGISASGSDTHGIANLGVGLIFNSISVRPGLTIPVGLDGADPTVNLTVGFNFGRKR